MSSPSASISAQTGRTARASSFRQYWRSDSRPNTRIWPTSLSSPSALTAETTSEEHL